MHSIPERLLTLDERRRYLLMDETMGLKHIHQNP